MDINQVCVLSSNKDWNQDEIASLALHPLLLVKELVSHVKKTNCLFYISVFVQIKQVRYNMLISHL